MGSNRGVYILCATGWWEVLGFRRMWNCVGRTAYSTAEEAEAELDGFLERCRTPLAGHKNPLPETVKAELMPLTLVDDLLDQEASEIFVLHACGHDSCVDGGFEAISETCYTSRQRASEAVEAFKLRCQQPKEGRFASALAEGLQVQLVALKLQPPPEPAPGFRR